MPRRIVSSSEFHILYHANPSNSNSFTGALGLASLLNEIMGFMPMNFYTECEIQAMDIQRNVLGKEIPI